jgi:hypothetical protein
MPPLCSNDIVNSDASLDGGKSAIDGTAACGKAYFEAALEEFVGEANKARHQG